MSPSKRAVIATGFLFAVAAIFAALVGAGTWVMDQIGEVTVRPIVILGLIFGPAIWISAFRELKSE